MKGENSSARSKGLSCRCPVQGIQSPFDWLERKSWTGLQEVISRASSGTAFLTQF